jgi:hypothetical protein
VSESKYTPGPWTVSVYTVTEEMHERLKVGTKHASVCTHHDPAEPTGLLVALCGDYPWERSMADAHLIAAATELLEALEQARRDIICLLMHGNFKDANFSTASIDCVDGEVNLDTSYITDAIKKARGGQ